MPELEMIERQYRELSARIVYAWLEDENVTEDDLARLEELAEMRVKLTAPDFRHLADETA